MSRMTQTRLGLRRFLDRPDGGMEVEMLYAAAELWFAISITRSEISMLNMTSLESLVDTVPHYYVAGPWWIASLLTFTGLVLYWLWNHPLCAALRWAGAFVSACLWFAMTWRATAEAGADLPSLAFYALGAAWQPRIMYSAFRRHRTWQMQRHG